MSKNTNGILRRGPQEWGAQARQDEDRLRGMRARGRHQSIDEQLDEMFAEADAREAEALQEIA